MKKHYLLMVFLWIILPFSIGLYNVLADEINLSESESSHIFPLFNNTLPSEYFYDMGLRGWGDPGDNETPIPGDGSNNNENPGLWVDVVLPVIDSRILFLFILFYVYRLFKKVNIINYKNDN